MINHCYHCGRRYIGCHALCGDYKAWRTEYDRVKSLESAENKQQYDLDDYAILLNEKSRRRWHKNKRW